MAQFIGVGAVGLITILASAGVTHVVKPIVLHGFSRFPRLQSVIRGALPIVELVLASWLLLAAVVGSRTLMLAALCLVGLTFCSFALYINYIKGDNPTMLTDCECTAVRERASSLGVLRAAIVGGLAFAMLLGRPPGELGPSWVWLAGLSLGILIVYVPSIWNMEYAHRLALNQEHDFAFDGQPEILSS